MKEFLITAQGYCKTDKYKQTMLLHDTFLANSPQDAETMFSKKFDDEYEILKIYSAQDLTQA